MLNALRTTIVPKPHPARRRVQRSPWSTSRPEMQLRALCWNTGGLSSGMLQEFMAWCETSAPAYDVIFLLETHWRPVEDYRSGHWLCVHTSGLQLGEEQDKYAGILCLLSSRTFHAPRVLEHVPGRLLQITATHVKSQLTTTLIGLYQHVWRPHLGRAANKALRSRVWNKLQSLVTSVPARHAMIVLGDFNATLKPCHPHVGRSAQQP